MLWNLWAHNKGPVNTGLICQGVLVDESIQIGHLGSEDGAWKNNPIIPVITLSLIKH